MNEPLLPTNCMLVGWIVVSTVTVDERAVNNGENPMPQFLTVCTLAKSLSVVKYTLALYTPSYCDTTFAAYTLYPSTTK